MSVNLEKIQEQGKHAWTFLREQDKRPRGWRPWLIAVSAVLLFGVLLWGLFMALVREPQQDQTARVHAQKDALLRQKIENASAQSRLAKNSNQLDAPDAPSKPATTPKRSASAAVVEQHSVSTTQTAPTVVPNVPPVGKAVAPAPVAQPVTAAQPASALPAPAAQGSSQAVTPAHSAVSNTPPPAAPVVAAKPPTPVTRSVQEICASKFIAFRSMCEWQECQRREHAQTAYCRRLKQYYETDPEKTY